MPLGPSFIFRLIIVLLLSGHVFYMYCLARTMGDAFGLSLATVFKAGAFGFIMLLPFVWAVFVPEWPEMYVRHIRARRWWRQGRCGRCGYSRTGVDAKACPECGEALVRPSGYQLSEQTVHRFVMINLLAWLVGCVTAETWILNDERDFLREASAQTSAEPHVQRFYTRNRVLPNETRSMFYVHGHDAVSEETYVFELLHHREHLFGNH